MQLAYVAYVDRARRHAQTPQGDDRRDACQADRGCRHAFGTIGYAEASMDDFTASAGLTRGALYHHFGDKKGLLQAVIAEIDGEMAARVNEVASKAPTRWQRFVDECTTYIEMALEPEIQRIMFRDGPPCWGIRHMAECQCLHRFSDPAI